MKPTATYRAMVGDRKRNAFIESAGLGVTGAFLPRDIELTWSEGEAVTLERAKKLCDVLKLALTDETTECESVTLLNLKGGTGNEKDNKDHKR